MITLDTQFSIVYNVAKTLQQHVYIEFFRRIFSYKRNGNQSDVQNLTSRYCREDAVLLHCDTIILTEYIYQTINQHKSRYQPNTTYDGFIASFYNTLLNSSSSEWNRRNGLMGMYWADARLCDWASILCAGSPPLEQYSTLFVGNRTINELYDNPTAVIKIAKKYYEEKTRCSFRELLMRKREQFFIFENAPEITKSYISSSETPTGDLNDIRTYREILEQEGLWY